MDKPLLHVGVVIMLYAVRVEGGGDADKRRSSDYNSLGYIGQNHYFSINKAVGWHEANRTCHSYPNTHLATFPDKDTLRVILEKAHAKKAFWFGAHEVAFEKWRWLDDQIYDGSMRDYGGEGKKTCGLVNSRAPDHMAYGTCVSEKRFLCINTYATSTNLGTDDYYISTTAEAMGWFPAREVCLGRGMDLAMAKDGSVDYIYSLLSGSTDNFWIGLQKARYVWENTGEAIGYLPWIQGEPNHWRAQEDCLNFYAGHYNDVSCTNRTIFICECEYTSNLPDTSSAAAPPEVTTRNQPEPTKGEPEEKRQRAGTGEAGLPGAVVALSVLGVVAVITLTLVLVVLVVRRVNKHGNTGNGWLALEEENREISG